MIGLTSVYDWGSAQKCIGGGLVASTGLTSLGRVEATQLSFDNRVVSSCDSNSEETQLIHEFLRRTEYRGSDVRLWCGEPDRLSR